MVATWAADMACLHMLPDAPRPTTAAAACQKQGINVTVACPPHTHKNTRAWFRRQNSGDAHGRVQGTFFGVFCLVYRCGNGNCLRKLTPHTLLYNCRQTKQA